MRSGSIGGIVPVMLLVGGIAAPLAIAELASPGDRGPALGVRSVAAGVADPIFSEDHFRPASTDSCTLAEQGVVALGTAPATAEPYALPVAEGAAPTVQPPAGTGAAVVIGSELRLGAPVVTAPVVEIDCQPKGDYRSSLPAAAPLKT